MAKEMRTWEIKEEILRLQAVLADLQDEYALARAKEKAAYAAGMAEKAAQAARDMENVIATRKRKRAAKREAAAAWMD